MRKPDNKPPRWHWFLPTSGDGRNVTNVIDRLGQTSMPRPADVGYLAEVARAAERAGFEAVLTPTGSGCEDAWVTCASVAQHTEKLKFIVAFRPDAVAPAWAAHQAASFQRLTDGRLLINVVTGGDPVEQKSFGDHLDKETRYRRTSEFLDVVKRSWSGELFDHEGEFFHLDQAGLRIGLEEIGIPRVYFGGASPPALEVAAHHADTWLTWGEPVGTVGERVEVVRERAESAGRSISCGLRIHVISRDTEDEAWLEAERILESIDPEQVKAAREKFSRMESTAQARMTELSHNTNGDGIDRDSLVIAPNLWAGVGLVREGAGTAIVGSHEQVAMRLLEYRDVGIDEFILSGYPHLEEALNFGENVRPLLDAAASEVAA
ncbi:MAG TPA: LLM class flavin-dependent oxidoreductase [Solirubrobacterales bacterium]|nr:LLM class flavin-dependent oxidoreductase [Solirubrobacterales bacterium]